MASLKKTSSISEYQAFIEELYGISNARFFNVDDMLSNIERFTMRGIKGIRKGNTQKVVTNLLIASGWFMSLMNQYHIDIEEPIWRRFPHLCSYCGSVPCSCKKNKVENRLAISIDERKRPKTLKGFQEMFEKIYPSDTRTVEHAGIHLAEETGELSEAFLSYKGSHSERDFANIVLESSDFVSCLFGVFNSIKVDFALELALNFAENCNACKRSPCACTSAEIVAFKS